MEEKKERSMFAHGGREPCLRSLKPTSTGSLHCPPTCVGRPFGDDGRGVDGGLELVFSCGSVLAWEGSCPDSRPAERSRRGRASPKPRRLRRRSRPVRGPARQRV